MSCRRSAPGLRAVALSPLLRLSPLILLPLLLALFSGPSRARTSGDASPPRAVGIPAIQGTGAASPMVGERVATGGVVTLVLPRGFFMQDPVGDGDPRTSDGVYVFTGWPPRVSAGDAVQVTGQVAEYNAGGKAGREPAGTLTELTQVKVARTGAGATVPVVPIVLPLEAGADLEHLEGMRVLLRAPLAVLAPPRDERGGTFTASCGPRLHAPTDLVQPGAAAQRMADRHARCRVLLDIVPAPRGVAAGGAPLLRAGQALGDIPGVVGATPAPGARASSVARIHPVAWAPPAAVPVPQPPQVGGNVRVASMNLQNFFTTLNDGRNVCHPGSARDCRGARTPAEFTRQRDKLVQALARLDADVVGLMEVENRPEATEALVDALNGVVGSRRYAAVRNPPRALAASGRADAIQVAMIYRADRLAPAGPPALDGAPVHDRPPLAQSFTGPSGGVFTVIVSHFKSKRCQSARGLDADVGDQQGCFNARRTTQALALRRFALQAAGPDADVLMVGDLNAHTREDPLRALTQGGAFIDQLARFPVPGEVAPYTYVFDGVAGRLDHALASPSLSAKVTGAAVWHVNADHVPRAGTDADPVRSSDHDPVVVGLQLGQVAAGESRSVRDGSPQAAEKRRR